MAPGPCHHQAIALGDAMLLAATDVDDVDRVLPETLRVLEVDLLS
jgi:hypothetical protein